MKRLAISKLMVAALLALSVTGCVDRVPKNALQLSPENLQRRQMQSRVFDTRDEANILSASAAVLQDLGFNLDESETDLGVIVASKRRDAREAGQIASALIQALILRDVNTEEEQKIRASLVTRPSGERRDRITVRITFQRTVWYEDGTVSRNEIINDPEIYQEFFSRLSKSVFLAANNL